MIPFVNLVEQYSQIAEHVEPDLLTCLRKCQFVGGHYLDRFELHLGHYLGVNNVVGVSNGTDAIMLALEALGVGQGDYVLCPNNSFIASAFGISRAGAKPILLDVNPDTYLLDVDKVEHILKYNGKRKRIKAILVVHLYGQMPDMERFRELAKQYKVFLIEDAAQAIGSTYKGYSVGFFSDIATTSFYPTKNLGTIGQGGAVITNDTTLANTIRTIINQGSEKKYQHVCLGGNYRLDALMAVYLYHALQKLNDWNDRRRDIAKIYNDEFSAEERPTQQPCSKHIYHLYEYKCKTGEIRDKIEKEFTKREVGFGLHYPNLISDLAMYHELSLPTPVANELRNRLLSLPMFPTMTDVQARTVIEAIREISPA